MKNNLAKIRLICCVLLLEFLVMSVALAQTQESWAPVKMEVVEINPLATGRPSKINVWFPEGQCNSQEINQYCLADSADATQVIVLSHGSMGSTNEYSWLGESLAAAGHIVVGVNHFGESWVYGTDTQNVRNTAFIWQRSQDVSAILDHLGKQAIFQRKVDWTRVVAIGHSAGGQTVAMLAGATFDLQLLAAYCKSSASISDLSCGYSRDRAKAPELFVQMFGALQKDVRVIKIILLDPALGAAANVESLHNIKVPALVVGATNNDFLPWPNHGLRYANEIPAAKKLELTGREGHFIFLNECNHDAEAMGVKICRDRSGADRKLTHDHITPAILDFIAEQTDQAELQQSMGAYHQAFITDNPLNSNQYLIRTIIINTPRWVFGLLLFLGVFGILQVRTRRVSIATALVMPFVMLCVSLSNQISVAGFHFLAFCAWSLGATLSALFCYKRFNGELAYWDDASKKLVIRGSWLPLAVMLIIFGVKYFLGVATAMHLNAIQNIYFLSSLSCIQGGATGYFLARGYKFFRLKHTTLGELLAGRMQ